MHFDKNMPLVSKVIENQMGMKQTQLIGTVDSQIPMFQLDETGKLSQKFFETIKMQTSGAYDLHLDGANIVNNKDGEVVFRGYKDLYKITIEFFKSQGKLFGAIPNEGLLFTIFYVFSMAVLGFHLWHGFQSAFQSLGINNRFTPAIQLFGKAFSVLVPLLFAIIPVYIHFILK